MASTKFEISKKDRNGASELMVRFCYDRKHSYRLHTLIWVPQILNDDLKYFKQWKKPIMWPISRYRCNGKACRESDYRPNKKLPETTLAENNR